MDMPSGDAAAMQGGEQEKPHGLVRFVLGAGLLVLVFSSYLLSMCRRAFPGESARLIVQHLGLDPFPPISHPLWKLAVSLLQRIPGGDVVFRLNLFSVVCGTLCVGLVYWLVSAIRHDRTLEETHGAVNMEMAQWISGLAAGLFLASCGPFWFVSTRAHTATFDILILLSCLCLLMRTYESSKRRYFFVFCLLAGLGTTEYATMIVWMPVLALAALYILLDRDLFSIRTFLWAVAIYACGLAPYFLLAWDYARSPAYEWRSFSHYFQVLWYIWLDQYTTIRHSVPRVGWLLVLVTTFIPGVIVFTRKRARKRGSRRLSHFLHLLLSLLALAVLFNVRFTPWRVLKLQPLLVAPYVLLAAAAGYLAGYGYLYFFRHRRRESPLAGRLRHFLRRAYIPALMVLLGLAFWVNYRSVNGKTSDRMGQWADQAVDALKGRTWLISNGVLDDSLLISAHQKGVPLHLLNTMRGRTTSYLRYISTLFDKPRLKSMALAGLMPLIDEWFSETPGVENEVAVLALPDLWLVAGFVPVPDNMLYFGVKDKADLNEEQVYRNQVPYWAQDSVRFRCEDESKTVDGAWARWVLMHTSRIANNTGFLMEELGREDLALEAYRQSRSMNTNNVSALLNLVMLSDRIPPPESDELSREYKAIAGKRTFKLGLWSLAQRYGYVHAPEIFAHRGLAWAMSGKPNMAFSDMQKAVALSGEAVNFQVSLAALYLGQNKALESEKVLADILKRDPANAAALFGFAQVCLLKGQYDEAKNYLGRLKELGVKKETLGLEEAAADMLAGNTDAARDQLLRLVRADSDQYGAWTLLALLASEEGDLKLLNKAVRMLEQAETHSPGIRLALARIACAQGDRTRARGQLMKALEAAPNHTQVLEMLIDLDLRDAKRDMARQHAEMLLGVDTGNPKANYALGLWHAYLKEYKLAESAYRKALERIRSPLTLNNLAWLLHVNGRDKEALPLIVESLTLNNQNAAAWDTLGVVLLQEDKLGEAEKALVKALQIEPERPEIIFHTAQLYRRKGMNREAAALLEQLIIRPSDINVEMYGDVEDSLMELRHQDVSSEKPETEERPVGNAE